MTPSRWPALAGVLWLASGCMVPPPRPLPPPPDVPDDVRERLGVAQTLPGDPGQGTEPDGIGLDRETGADREVDRPSGVLRLDDVLDSVEAAFPLLLAAREEIEIAEAQIQAASGSFDPGLVVDSKLAPLGYYETYRADAFVKQATPYWGASVAGGYRIGRGEFADYDREEQTNESGEVRLELAVPLLQDRSIDARRVAVWKARIARDAADPVILEQRIEFVRKASLAYWEWVAAGAKLRIARQLLSLAETRRESLGESVAEGLLPELVLTDNQRLVAERRAILHAAERGLEKTGLKLALYHRDRDGRIRVPEEERLPASFPEPTRPEDGAVERDVALARDLRPELRTLQLAKSDLEIDVRLLENRLLPSLDAKIAGSQDLGAAADLDGTKDPFELKTGIVFSVPLGLRSPRGKLRSSRAKLRQLSQKLRYLEDKVETEVRDAESAIRQAWLRISAAAESVELSTRMEEAERLQLTEGNSDLLRVNLREQQSARAASFLVEVTAQYFEALADYRAAVGLATDR